MFRPLKHEKITRKSRIKVTQINYVSRNQLHSTVFLLSTFEFERQNIAGWCKDKLSLVDVNKLFVFSSVLNTWLFKLSQCPTEWAQKFKFLQKSCRVKWFHEMELRGLYLYFSWISLIMYIATVYRTGVWISSFSYNICYLWA